MAVSALAATGLALGLGTHGAAAVPGDPGNQPDLVKEPPHVESLRVEGNTAYVTFVDNSVRESSYQVQTWGKNANGDFGWMSSQQPPTPGKGRVPTGVVTGVPPGVPICAYVEAEIHWSDAMDISEFTDYLKSNTVCVDPATAPADLALENIRGREELQFAVNPESAYLVHIRSVGVNADAKDVTVDITTWGVATLGDQGVVRPGWESNGFTCTTTSPTSLRCSGGSVKQGAQIDPAVIVRFTGPGFGHIRAEASAPGEKSPGNNGTTFNVHVL